MTKQALLKYVPKEYKTLVVDIYEAKQEYDEQTKRMITPIIIEWQNGEISTFQHKTWMRFCLKECHDIGEFSV